MNDCINNSQEKLLSKSSDHYQDIEVNSILLIFMTFIILKGITR